MSPRLRTAHATAATAAAGQAAQVSLLIGEMMSHLHRRSAGDTLALMNEAGLTMAQMVALHVLAHAGTKSVSSVAACLRLSPAATSHLIDRLVGSGLVGRSEDPVDRRHKRIAITPPGRILIDRVQEERTRELARVFSRLPGELQRQFARVLGRVVGELKMLPDTDASRAPRARKREVESRKVYP